MSQDIFGKQAAPAYFVDPRQGFFVVFCATLLLKLWLAAAFPMTGDEAFFYQWGLHPDWGYYDHPPMVGWMLAVLSRISDAPLVLRSVTVLLWSAIALGLVDLLLRLQPENRDAAYRLGSLFLVQPFAWGLNLVTTDTPLILFVFLSGYAFIREQLSPRRGWDIACGVFLGLALLSKYFAALLALAYVVHLARRRGGWRRLAIIGLAALPFFAENLWYNATHCWNNVMFNVFNRNEGTHWSPGDVALYVGMMIYLLTPWVCVRLLRTRHQMSAYAPLTVLFLLPFALLLLISTRKVIGLHWVLGFVPFVFLFVGAVTADRDLYRYFRWSLWLSLPHLAALAFLILAPTRAWEGFALHDDVVFHKRTGDIVARLRQDLPERAVLMARAYSPAAILSYHAGAYVPTFGEGRFHARQDDVLVDFRDYDGRPVRIFDRHKIEAATLAPFFDRVSVGTFEIDGIPFWFADGTNFKYPVYRERVLARIAERYYRIPAFLPVFGCPFLTRYDFPCPTPAATDAAAR